MKKNLGLYETRILGVLIEKEITTPDQYPLSLNALTNACNQKSNRFPVLSLSQATVSEVLSELSTRGLVLEDSFKSRVEKYSHKFCNTEFGELQFGPDEVAVICELMLRGPQTPGELRSRAHRMHPFGKVDEVEKTLEKLSKHPKGPFIAELPREPGKRESRYAHTLNSDVEPIEMEPPDAMKMSASKAEVEDLKQQVSELQEENAQLKKRLRQLGEVC